MYAIRSYYERCDILELPRSAREAVLEEAREGLLTPGRQFLLPLVYGRLDTIFVITSYSIHYTKLYE